MLYNWCSLVIIFLYNINKLSIIVSLYIRFLSCKVDTRPCITARLFSKHFTLFYMVSGLSKVPTMVSSSTIDNLDFPTTKTTLPNISIKLALTNYLLWKVQVVHIYSTWPWSSRICEELSSMSASYHHRCRRCVKAQSRGSTLSAN